MSRSLSRVQAVVLGATVLAGLVLAALAVSAIGSHQWLWGDTFHLNVGFRQSRADAVGGEVDEAEALHEVDDRFRCRGGSGRFRECSRFMSGRGPGHLATSAT